MENKNLSETTKVTKLQKASYLTGVWKESLRFSLGQFTTAYNHKTLMLKLIILHWKKKKKKLETDLGELWGYEKSRISLIDGQIIPLYFYQTGCINLQTDSIDYQKVLHPLTRLMFRRNLQHALTKQSNTLLYNSVSLS